MKEMYPYQLPLTCTTGNHEGCCEEKEEGF